MIGLHIHAGSGIVQVDNWTNNAKLLFNVCKTFPSVRMLNLGGGIGVPYNPKHPALPTQSLDDSLAQLKEQFRKQLNRDLQFWMEPGRFVVAHAGILLATVTQLKTKPGRKFVGINTGMNSLIRPALYSSYHHIVNVSRLSNDDTQDGYWSCLHVPSKQECLIADVVGPICETGDVLGKILGVTIVCFGLIGIGGFVTLHVVRCGSPFAG